MQTKFQRKAISARIANRTPKGGLSCRKKYAAIMWLRMQMSSFPMQESVCRPSQHRAYSVMRQTPKISGVLIVLAALALGGCGGSSEVPAVVTPPVVVAPRVWSAPLAGPIAFQNVNLTAAPDSCGGITLFGIHENIWKRQRYSPATGWETSAQPLFGTYVTASDEIQILDTLTVPTVFVKLTEASEKPPFWHQLSYRCDRNEWWGGVPFPVEYFPATDSSSQPVPIPVHFSRTFDHQILAASVLPDRSAITLRQLSVAIWQSQETPTLPTTAALDQDSNANAVKPMSVSKVSAARTASGDAATVVTSLGKVVAFRLVQSNTFTRLSEPEICLGHGCQLFLRSFALPRVEADGTAAIVQNGSFPDGQSSWFRFSATGLRLIVALPSLYGSAESAVRVLRPDGVAVWLASDGFQRALRIVENGVVATWSGTSEGEAVGLNNASLNAFSAPDGDSLATLRLGDQTSSKQPRLSISRRTGPAVWARDFTVDLTALFARYPNPNSIGAGLVAFRELTNRTWIVGTLMSTDATGGLTYQPFLLWR